jgi:hypothetical protein
MTDLHAFHSQKEYTSFYPYYLPNYYQDYYPRKFRDQYYEPRIVSTRIKTQKTEFPGSSFRWILAFILIGAFALVLKQK